MLKYIIKQIRRSAFTNTYFCLLLALSGALLCISAGLWYSAHKALLDIDRTVTTIAIPNTFAIKQKAINQIISSGITEYDNGESTIKLEDWGEEEFLQLTLPYFEEEIRNTIRDEVYRSDLLTKDSRRAFGAFSPGNATAPIRAMGLGLAPELASNSPQANAAFIVTCDSLRYESYVYSREEEDGAVTYFLVRHIYANFTVEEPILLHSAYQIPQGIIVRLYTMPSAGSSPVEPGKRYVVTGRVTPQGARYDMYVEYRNANAELCSAGFIGTMNELKANTMQWMIDSNGLSDDNLPMEVFEYVNINEPGSIDFGYNIFELEGSLEEALGSGQNERMRSELEIVENAFNSFVALTTNDANSIFRFNQSRELIDSGRLFSIEEAESGARVCLISKQFAELNGLAVGDTLPLRMYDMKFLHMISSYGNEDGSSVFRSYWMPSLLYEPGQEISELMDYTIVGILNILSLDSGDYAISPNTVIIPDRSFEGLTGAAGDEGAASDEGAAGDSPGAAPLVAPHIPLLDDNVIVPNGRVDEVKAIIDDIAEGYGSLFRFYDQGYETLIRALSNLRSGMTWILVISAASWVAVGFLFLMFFVSRKRKETWVLNALGVSRPRRLLWVFVQSAALILIALGITLAVSLPLYSKIIDLTAAAAEEFTVSFRDLTLSDAAEIGTRRSIPLDRSSLAALFTASAGALLLLVVSGFMSARSAVFKSLGSGRRDD